MKRFCIFSLIIFSLLFAGLFSASAQQSERARRRVIDSLRCAEPFSMHDSLLQDERVRRKGGKNHRDAKAQFLHDSLQQGERVRRKGGHPHRESRPYFLPDSVQPIAGTVGLVMSGGGAKGLYHIGVIRALEEHNVPIDYVSGTSMGAIVAALYASGYSAEEMTELVTSGMVEQWVSGKIDDRYRFHFSERPEAPHMLSVYGDVERDTLSGKGSVEMLLPHAFVSTAQIDMALIELFAAQSAASGGNFDKLMVPFRCIASDINAHQAVEMREGNLPLAVRASMAYPALFRPVTDEKGRVLIDGGCYDNFPWKVMAKDFDPDFIIGSYCVERDKPASESSRLETQIMALVTEPTDYEMSITNGFLVGRAVPTGLLEFSAADRTIQMGYDDMMERMPELLARFTTRREKSEVERRRSEYRETLPEMRFGEGELVGLPPRDKLYAETMLNFEKPRKDSLSRKATSYEDVRDRFYSLMSTGEFEINSFPVVRYDSTYNDFAICFDLSTKPELKISVGGNLSSTAYNQFYLGFNYLNFGRTAQTAFVDMALGPVSAIVRAGGRSAFIKRTPMYLDFSLQMNRRSTLQGSYGNITPAHADLEVRTIEPFASLSWGIATTRKSVLEVGVNGGFHFISYEEDYDEGVPSTHDRFRFLAARAMFQHSSLDKMLYPTSGSRFAASIIGVTGRDRWEDAMLHAYRRLESANRSWVGAKLEWEHYPGNWNKTWFSMGYSLEAVYTNHPTFGNYNATILTAPRYTPLPHAKMIYMPQFYANRYAAVGFMPTFSLMRNFYLRGGFYALLRDPLVADEYLYYMSDLSFVYHTRVGAVSLSVTKYDLKSWDNCYVTFNFGYPIFGKRGLYY